MLVTTGDISKSVLVHCRRASYSYITVALHAFYPAITVSLFCYGYLDIAI